jgi:hypothetical protein
VGFDGPFAQHQDVGNLAIEFPLRDQCRYFAFARRQPPVSLLGSLFV